MSAAAAVRSGGRARLAGLLYIATIAAGLFAEVGVRSAFRGEGALAITDNMAFYRSGELADLVMLCCYVAVTALFYDLFAPDGRRLSQLAAAFSLTGIAVLASAGVLHLAPAELIARQQDGGACANGCAAAVTTLLDLHGAAYGISLIFFGAYCILIGSLVLRSRSMPAIVGVMMIVGGLSHLTTKALGVVYSDIAFPRPILLLPLIGEATLAAWLLIFGVRDRGKAVEEGHA
jgi:hypothetical protein